MASRVVLLLLACWVGLGPALAAATEGELTQRVALGGRIFRLLLDGETRVQDEARRAGPPPLLVIGEASSPLVTLAVGQLSAPGSGPAPAVRVVPLEEFLALTLERPQGAFLAQRLGAPERARLLAHTAGRPVLLFTPFEGEVEQGVMAGFVIEARVRPHVNLAALRASGLELREIHLKASLLHGR